ncbi:MAG: IS6 family transposase, partial [Rhabdochlamydiaceae bacterium]
MPANTTLEIRAQRGKEISEMKDAINRLDETTYKVKSQTKQYYYEVLQTENGWACQCPDYRYRATKCKHIFAVEFSFTLRTQVQKRVQILPVIASNCPKCNSLSIKKAGLRHNKYGNIQKFQCKECGYWFTINLGFEGMHATPQIITSAMQLYFTGASFRSVKNFLKLQEANYSHQSVYNWVQKYFSLMETYLDEITPQVGNAWRTDELFLKIKGDLKYLFAMMDSDTRFWIAQQVATNKGTDDVKPMFRESVRKTGKNPRVLISDGAFDFGEASKVFKVHGNKFSHIREIRMEGIVHNNKMERMNGELRDREKTMRSLKTEDTPVLKGMQIFHNYIRPHMAPEG